jgi:ankyrin repeat protein
LLWVCKYGHTDILEYLLDYGVDIGDAPMSTTYNKDTQSAIGVYEVLFQHGLELSRFPGILAYASYIFCQIVGRHSLIEIFCSAWIENETMLRYLLSKGADPNGLDEDDSLPLELCTGLPIIKLLIDSGADVSRVNILQESMTTPNDFYSEEILDFLLEVGVDINARAVYTGEFSTEPDSRLYAQHMQMTGNGGTALHWVVRGWGLRGHPKVDLVARAKWLLDRGARVDIKDDNGLIPLDYAVDPLMIDLLNQYGLQGDDSQKSDTKV